jgi:hypothetical protein
MRRLAAAAFKTDQATLGTIVIVLVAAGLLPSCDQHPECDCTIVPFKSSCFEQCVTKVLSQASYGKLTGTYGLPHDTATKIISAREHGTPLDVSTRSKIDAFFREKERSAYDRQNK